MMVSTSRTLPNTITAQANVKEISVFNVTVHPLLSEMSFPFIILMCVHDRSLQSCSILCNPLDCSPPGSSVHGILQSRILEWVVISFSRGSFPARDQTHVSYISCTGRWILYHWATGEAPANCRCCCYFKMLLRLEIVTYLEDRLQTSGLI